MPGPPPDPNARRRNAGSAFRTLPLRGLAEDQIPDLPPKGGRQRWKDATRSAWSAWWTSPMATEWEQGDLPTVVLIARCYDDALRGDPKAASEFRLWADRFGLSPMARQKNRWLLQDEDTAAASDGSVVALKVASSDA